MKERTKRVEPKAFICPAKTCKNLQSYYGESQEIVCNGCGRTYDGAGKELKDKPRTINPSGKLRFGFRPDANRVSIFDKGTGDLMFLNEDEAKALKKFLNEVV